jgi:branched-chain amino acid transport system substrate-binding protein
MKLQTLLRHCSLGAAIAVALTSPFSASAGNKDINVGVIFDYSGKLAATSETAAVGTKIAIDMINERGGVEGYKINAIYADAQSKPKIAIKEAVRLFDKEKADLLMGVYSSSQCVPLATKLDAEKRFFWANVCISSKVFKGRSLKYVFRAQAQSDVFGLVAPDFLAAFSREKLGIDPKDLRVAIVYRDAAAGRGVSKGNAIGAKKHGMQVVLNQGYDIATTNQAPLVAKLKAANPDVILHGGTVA